MKRWLVVLACLLPAWALAQSAPPMPVYATVEGQPIDARPPSRPNSAPLFPEQTRAPYRKTAPYTVTVLAQTLRAPWALAVLPGGDILVTERLPGSFRIVARAGGVSEPLSGLDALGVKTPMTGLLDVVLDENFASNRRIYFTFFEYEEKTVSNTFLARAVLDEKARALREVKVIFRASPLLPNDANLGAGTKTGGRIAIGGDGYLYVAIGDRDVGGARPWGVGQILDTHLGKIVRLTKDGKPAPGNPFARTQGALPEIWAYGQRNQLGLTADPQGRIWQTENGPRGGDELNLIRKGGNYGWPVISHGLDYSGAPIAKGAAAQEGMEQPVYYWSPSTAPAGLAFYQGELFPQWQGSVLVTMMNGRMLSRLALSGDKVVAEEALLTELKDRLRDVRVGRNGAVYVLTDTGGSMMTDTAPPTSRLVRLTPL